MREKARILLFDTVVLSNFALVKRLELLERLAGETPAVTCEVLDEIASGISKGYEALRAIERVVTVGVFKQIMLTSDERSKYIGLLRNLGSGEASCIAVATTRKGSVVATDDLVARNICRELRCPVTGTIGILQSMLQNTVLTAEDANRLLDEMILNGFYSPVQRLRD